MKKLNVLAGVFLISLLVFAVSCVTKEYQVTETYYQTEMQQEPYTTIEDYEISTPHSSTIFQQNHDYAGAILLLFNNDNDRNISWAPVSAHNDYPHVQTFKLQTEGQHHRILVSAHGSPIWVTVWKNRLPAAIDQGFQPCFPLHELVQWRDSVLMPNNPLMQRSGADVFLNMASAGYHSDELDAVGESRICGKQFQPTLWTEQGIIDQTPLLPSSVSFSLKAMFQADGWSLIVMRNDGDQLYWCSPCPPISVDYVWDDVEIGTREVTKYRDVPVQVEKQRTVTETRQVPFWEAIFGE